MSEVNHNHLPPGAGIHRYVFALTTDGSDVFHAMTRIAAASVKLAMPAASIAVCLDGQSLSTLDRNSLSILNDGYDIISVSVPDGPAAFRNRWMKTSLHEHIKEPFVYLDADVLVRGSLDAIFDCGCDFAAARNHSSGLLHQQFWIEDSNVFASMNWETEFPVYFNGGVLYFSQSSRSKSLCSEWHRSFIQSYNQLSRARDQPALNHAIAQSKASIHILNDAFNAQFIMTPRSAIDANLWHFYASDINGVQITEFDRYATECMHTNTISTQRVAWMMRQSHPWRSRTPIDSLIARSIFKRNSISASTVDWYAQPMSKYLVMKMKRMYWYSLYWFNESRRNGRSEVK